MFIILQNLKMPKWLSTDETVLRSIQWAQKVSSDLSPTFQPLVGGRSIPIPICKTSDYKLDIDSRRAVNPKTCILY